jgi:hypothetical protein
MTTGAEEQTKPDEGAGTTDLKSELRHMLAKDFKKRLTESERISEEQCKRLCGLLADGSISAPNIEKALTGDQEPMTND